MNRNRWASLVALLLVPLLAAGSFLWGLGRTDSGLRTVQAAIVNNDEMVEVNGQMMPLGRQLAAELVDSDRDQNFSWVMATEEKAREGLRTGRYAAVVTIPKEFSAAATSFSGEAGKAHKATIHVETSPVAGLSEAALGQSIADAATNALNRFLTGEYLKNIYIGFNQMQEQMLTLVDGTRQLADGAGQLADGADKSADGAGQLADGLGQAADGSPKLREGAASAASGAQALADGLGLASAGSAQLRDGVQKSVAGAGQLSGGATQLADGTRQWADGANRYAAGVRTYADGVRSYTTGVGTYVDGVKQYADGVDQYTGAVNSLLVPLRGALDLIPEWGGWLDDVRASLTDLTDRAIAFDQRVQEAITKIRAYVVQAMGLAQQADGVRTGVTGAQTRAAALEGGSAKIACPTDFTEEQCAAFQRGLKVAGAELKDVLGSVSTDAGSLATDADVVKKTGEAILKVLDEVSQASTQMVAWAPKVQAELQRLDSSIPEGTPTTKAGVMSLLDQFINAGTMLQEGGQKLVDGGAALRSGGTELANGGGQLAGGAVELADGAGGLASGTDQLASGVGALASGLSQLGQGINAYTGGVDQAAAGADQLAGGLGQLSSGVNAYTSGVEQASDGAQLLAGGLNKLASGAGDLADGTDELADGVAEGADEIPTYTDAERDQLSGVVASPVDTTGLDVVVRPNLAWVSLLLVTALWIGALATTMVVPPLDRRATLSSASNGRLLRAQLLPSLGIITAQAVLLGILGAVVLKFTPAEGALLTGILVAAGLTFGLVNYALGSLFGLWGRIASMVMALITAVTAATMTAPALLQGLRSLSPLSPALDAVRSVETGGSVTVPVLVLVGWAILGAAGAIMAVTRTRMVPLDAVAKAA